ncbi:MAG: PAS domain S-box protein [Planctomycetes bacterium]|nr:PAS domain S-box protein [Planctomycetota bacterium]
MADQHANSAVDGELDALRRRVAELEQNQSMYRVLTENASEMIAVIDGQDRFLFINKAVVEILGAGRPEDVLGKTIWDFSSKGIADSYAESVHKAIETGKGSMLETPVILHGRQRWYRTSIEPIPDDHGWANSALLIGRDITDQRSEREKRRSIQKLLSDIMSHARVVIYRLDVRTATYDYVSPACKEWLGFDSEEFAALKLEGVMARMHPEDWAINKDRIEWLIQGRPQESHIRPLEYRWRLKDGQYAWFRDTRNPVYDEDGNLVSIVGTMESVGKRKKMEKALRESEHRLRLILENSYDGIDIYALDVERAVRKLVMCNDRYVEMSGYTREELMAAENLNDLSRVVQQLTRLPDAMRRGVPCRGISTWLRPDGKENYYEWSAVPLVIDGQLHVVGVDRDITERQRAEQRLRLITSLVEQSKEGTAAINMEGNLLYVNEAFASMHGFSIEELVGRHVSTVHTPEQMLRVNATNRQVRKTGEFDGEIWHTRKDGSVFPSMMHNTLLRDENGETIGIIGTMRDITEDKKAAKRLRKARSRLMNAAEDERRRLARESHDSVGQGLIAMQLVIQKIIASQPDKLREDDARALTAVAEQSTELIRQVRDISHGLYPPVLESLGLAAALRQLGKQLGKGTALKLCFPKDVEKLPLDAERQIVLFRIAQEAVSNALRHSGASRIELSLRHENDRVNMSVTDNGSGFDNAGHSPNGLGLVSMRDRAGAVGGELEILSQPGRTVVTVSVPLAAGEGRNPGPRGAEAQK